MHKPDETADTERLSMMRAFGVDLQGLAHIPGDSRTRIALGLYALKLINAHGDPLVEIPRAQAILIALTLSQNKIKTIEATIVAAKAEATAQVDGLLQGGGGVGAVGGSY